LDEESAMIDFRLTARGRNVTRSSQGKRRVTKRERHTAIRDLIAAQVVGSQEELRLLLRSAGWDVTQSTLSRDLREMRVARVPTTEGPRYATPETLADGTADRTLVEDILPQFFSSVDGVGELMVLKTIYGGAQPVAEAIDDAGWKEVVGTIGGENTILVICRSAAARETVEKRLVKIANG
jgi:transcriptional regulator of arginine metabolism